MRLRKLGIAVVGVALAAVSGVAMAAPKSLADYPLRVHIYNTHWGYGGESAFIEDYSGYHGHGRANLTDGPDTRGMEYTFECDSHFMTSDPGESYPAKWKKQGQELEMLMTVIGTDKMRTCHLKVTLKDFVYERRNGKLETVSIAENKQRVVEAAAREVALAPVDKDPSHYPMKLSILDLDWSGKIAGMHHGSGHGNLQTPEGLSAVDMALACPATIHVTPEGRFYHARWTKPGSELEILLHKTGEPDAAATCEVKTSLHTDVYVLQSAGVLKTVSREKFKSMQTADAKEPPAM
jgi:hypothetical protein